MGKNSHKTKIANEQRAELIKKNKELVLQALEKTLGVVTPACKMVNIPRNTFYSWLHSDPKFKANVDEIREVTIDFAESSLFKQIKSGNVASTIFFLKTRAKQRGYVEANININKDVSDLSKLTDDELDSILKGEHKDY